MDVGVPDIPDRRHVCKDLEMWTRSAQFEEPQIIMCDQSGGGIKKVSSKSDFSVLPSPRQGRMIWILKH